MPLAGLTAWHTQEIKDIDQRFSDLTEFDVKKQVTLNFATGKATLSQEAQASLDEVAKEAQGLKGYLIDVQGYASTSGTAARNQALSDQRADAVVTYLHQHGIAPQHIVTPAAMGTTKPVAGNETEEDRLKNQRVEVKVLVNKGLAEK